MSSMTSNISENNSNQNYLLDCLKNLKKLSENKSEFENENKIKMIVFMNKRIKFLNNINSDIIDYLKSKEILCIMRDFLIDPDEQISENSAKFFRLLMSKDLINIYKELKIHILISKNIENFSPNSCFITEYIKLIKKWEEFDSKDFPIILGRAVIFLSKHPNENLKSCGIEILRGIAIHNTKLCCFINGFEILINSLLESDVNIHFEDIVYTIIFLLNDPSTRKYFIKKNPFSKLFALFYENSNTNINVKDSVFLKNLQSLTMAKKIISLIFKQWAGILYLGWEKNGLKSLIECLRKPNNKNNLSCIIDIFDELLNNAEIYILNKENLIFSEFISNISVFQIKLLLDYGLYDVLIENSNCEDKNLSLNSIRLLKKFNKLLYNIFPFHKIPQPDYLIMSLDNKNEYFLNFKPKISKMMEEIGSIPNEDWYGKNLNNNKLMFNIENIYLSMPSSFPDLRLNKDILNNIYEKDNIKEDLILNNNMKNWNYKEIICYLNHLSKGKKFIKDELEKKFLKSVLKFFQPSVNEILELDWSSKNLIILNMMYKYFQIILKTGNYNELLLQNFSDNFFIIHQNYLYEMKNLLEDDLKFLNKSKNSKIFQSFNGNLNKSKDKIEKVSILEFDSYIKTFTKEYFNLISLLTHYKIGRKYLQDFKIFPILEKFVKTNGNRDYFIGNLLIGMKYNNVYDNMTKDFLIYCLDNGSHKLIKICLNIIYLLVKSEMKNILKWAGDSIIKLFSNSKNMMQNLILDLIEELIETENDLDYLIKKLNYKETNINKRIIYIFSKFNKGILLLKEKNILDKEYEKWINKKNLKFLEKSEKITYFQIENKLKDKENEKYEYKFINYYNNYKFLSSPFYIASLLKFPWNIRIDSYSKSSKKKNEIVEVIFETYCYLIKRKNILLIKGNFPSKKKHLLIKEVNTNWFFNCNLYIGNAKLNHLCQNEENENYSIRMDFYNKNFKKINANEYIIDKGGIYFYFEEINENVMFLKNIEIPINLNFSNEIKKNKNFIGLLGKTVEGCKFLEEKNACLNIFNSIKEYNKNDLASLMCLGYIGKYESGIKLLEKYNLIKPILSLSKECENLPIRGSIFNIANLFVRNELGRKILKLFDWEVYLVKKENENYTYYTLPKNLTDIFLIETKNVNNNDKKEINYWDTFNNLEKDIIFNCNEVEKIFINFLKNKAKNLKIDYDKQEFKAFCENNLNIFSSTNVFYYIILLITFLDLEIKNFRSYFFYLLEKFFKFKNFWILLDSNKNYQDLIINI